MKMDGVYYQVYEGSGNSSSMETKNIILFHGFMGSGLDWNSLGDFLLKNSSSLKIISILLPGHTQTVHNFLENTFSKDGFSEIKNTVDTFNNSINKFSKQVLEIQKKEKVLNCTYLGYSMGGRFAMELAGLNECTESLILESSFTHWENKNEQQEKKEEDFSLFKNLLNQTKSLTHLEDSKKHFKEFLLKWYNLNLFKGLVENKDFPLLLEKRLQQNIGQLHEALQAYSSGTINSYLEILKNLNCPIHYIYGEQDSKYKNIGLNLKKLISHVNLQEVKNASHNTHFQQEEIFNSLILDLIH